MFKRLFLLAIIALVYACVKPASKSPIPTLTFKELADLRKNPNGSDTATLILGYEDGDGDLFADNSNDPPNLIVTYYYFNSDSGKLVKYLSEAQKIFQPNKGYYKGKSIRGEITYPLGGYRKDNTVKRIKLKAFMVDKAQHQTNIVSSPEYTLNF